MAELLFNLPSIAKSIAVLLGLAASSFGVTFLLSPLAAAESFGLPQTQVQKKDTTFLRILGGRNLAIGLMGLALVYQRDFKGVGTTFLCLVIPGTLDSVLIWRQGIRSAAWGHIMGTIVFVILGGYFVLGNTV
jgi:hypothetical protein